MEKMFIDPYIVNTLSGVAVNVISSLAVKFKKRPRTQKMQIEFEASMVGIILDDNQVMMINKFMNRRQVQQVFYNYITYQSYNYEMQGHELLKSISENEFVNILSNSLAEFLVQNECFIEEKILREYFKVIVSLLQDRIINKFSIENRYIYNCLSNIENRLTSALVLNSLSKNEVGDNYDFSNYIKALKKINSTTHVYGVDVISLDDFYIMPDLSVYKKEDTSDVKELPSLNELFKYSNIVSFIGGPGYGKSTFIKYLILNYEKLDLFNSNEMIPIVTDLKEFALNQALQSHYSIIDFLIDSMVKQTGISSTNDLRVSVLNQLASGNCLILFDALDEVKSDERENIYLKIVSFFESFNPNNKVIITSRVRGFVPHTEYIIEINKLNSRNVKEYLGKITGNKKFIMKKNDVESFKKQADVLINSKFLTSFLMLSLLVNVYKSEQELPTTKHLIYKKCVDHIVRQRENRDKKTKYNFDQIQYMLKQDYTFEELTVLGRPNNINVSSEVVLSHLSKTYEKKYGSFVEAYNAVEELLRFMGDRTDFYIKASLENEYKFFHRSFYDYYVSRRIYNNFKSYENLFDEICINSTDSEVYELIVEILFYESYEKYLGFIEYVLDRIEESFGMGFGVLDSAALILKNITEKEYVSRYYNFIKNINVYELSEIETINNISEFIKNNKLEEDYYSFIANEYPFETYRSFVLVTLWRVLNIYDKGLFSNISYDYYDYFFQTTLNFGFVINFHRSDSLESHAKLWTEDSGLTSVVMQMNQIDSVCRKNFKKSESLNIFTIYNKVSKDLVLDY